MDPTNSSYENLFKLCSFLKIPHAQTEELFRRMVFNVLYGNVDDHLKNHSFIYNNQDDSWQLSPAYDITYALNPLTNIKKSQRAMSINGKRSDIIAKDLYKIADDFTIKNPTGVIKRVQSYKEELMTLFGSHKVPKLVAERIGENIIDLV